MLCCLLTCLFSCSNLLEESDEGSTLTLCFNGAGLNGGVRNVVANDDDPDATWLIVALSGDYTATKTVNLSDIPDTYQMVFDDISVGASIVIQANVYSNPSTGTSDFYHLYTGSSSLDVVAGQNTVNLAMTNVSSAGTLRSSLSASADNTAIGSVVFIQLYDKKYIIECDGKIVSEGIWQGNLSEPGTLYFTEYVYKSNSLSFDTVILTDYPHTVAVDYSCEADGSLPNFSFTSANGVTFTVP